MVKRRDRTARRSRLTSIGFVVVAIVGSACAAAGQGSPTASTAAPSAATASASLSPSAATPTPWPTPTPDAAVHVALTGRGPIGLDLASGHAWVVLPDSGTLSEVDLAASRELRSIDVGTGGSHVAIGATAVYVGRFDNAGGGETLVVIDPTTGAVSGVGLGPLESVSYGDGTVWALEKSGAIRILDAATLKVTGSASVHIDADAHAEAVPAAGALWVSGDRTPVHRIDRQTAKVGPDIETGGGIPLTASGGLVWGARADELWAIDPASGAVSRRIPLTGLDEILALDVDGDEAWIAARKPGRVGTVLRLDLSTQQVVADYAVSLPAGVGIDAERAWVTSYDTNELLGFPRN